MAFIGFGLITVYMTFAAFFLAIKSINELTSTEGPLNFGDFFTNSIFRNVVISIAATLGLYIVASLLFLEPWHMITSFIQYLLMAPSYINVLNVYAFANVHDVSWGTKGDNKVSTDLGVVSTGKDKGTVEASVPTDQRDINAAYEDAMAVLNSKPPVVEQKRDAATKQEDYYRSFRTNVLLAWTLSNGLLAAVVSSATGPSATTSANKAVGGYMAFILFSVAALAGFRFVGSTAYMIIRLFAGE
ncbi:Chitin synthase, class 1 [Ceratobasidium sp. 394]|nr:Chitin synthase, class 1 [Ceratobasidium sp. 394]